MRACLLAIAVAGCVAPTESLFDPPSASPVESPDAMVEVSDATLPPVLERMEPWTTPPAEVACVPGETYACQVACYLGSLTGTRTCSAEHAWSPCEPSGPTTGCRCSDGDEAPPCWDVGGTLVVDLGPEPAATRACGHLALTCTGGFWTAPPGGTTCALGPNDCLGGKVRLCDAAGAGPDSGQQTCDTASKLTCGWSACLAFDKLIKECEPGDIDTLACNEKPCGSRHRLCGADGQWGEPGPCFAQADACEPGDTKACATGGNKKGTMTCSNECTYSACVADPCADPPSVKKCQSGLGAQATGCFDGSKTPETVGWCSCGQGPPQTAEVSCLTGDESLNIASECLPELGDNSVVTDLSGCGCVEGDVRRLRSTSSYCMTTTWTCVGGAFEESAQLGAVGEDCDVGDAELCGLGCATFVSKGVRHCGADCHWEPCHPIDPKLGPGIEQCDNAQDDDCDGWTDEGCGAPDNEGAKVSATINGQIKVINTVLNKFPAPFSGTAFAVMDTNNNGVVDATPLSEAGDLSPRDYPVGSLFPAGPNGVPATLLLVAEWRHGSNECGCRFITIGVDDATSKVMTSMRVGFANFGTKPEDEETCANSEDRIFGLGAPGHPIPDKCEFTGAAESAIDVVRQPSGALPGWIRVQVVAKKYPKEHCGLDPLDEPCATAGGCAEGYLRTVELKVPLYSEGAFVDALDKAGKALLCDY